MTAAGAVLDLSSLAAVQLPPRSRGFNQKFFKATVNLDLLDVDHVDDAVLVFQYPVGAWVPLHDGSYGITFDSDADFDTHGTETLELDLAVGGSDGAADQLLLSGASSVIAEVGGSADYARGTALTEGTYFAAGSLYLQLIVRVKAATPADGTVVVYGSWIENFVNITVSSTNL